MELAETWTEDSGITINWVNEPDEVWNEKKNLLLASGELPDALFNTGLSDAEVAKYGANGTFIALEELIPEHAPTLHGILEERPDIRSAMTASDGHIYTLPSVEELGLVEFPRMLFINTDWLDQYGLEMPTTVDEYHEALLAFKGGGPSGVLPLSFIGAGDIADLIAAIGGQADNADHRIVQDGKVVFTADKDGFRDAIATLHTWYGEGLIDQESFAQDYVKFIARGRPSRRASARSTSGRSPRWSAPSGLISTSSCRSSPGPTGCSAPVSRTTRRSTAVPSPSAVPTSTPRRRCAGPTCCSTRP
ncbi:extracellular solute-binding protein [Brachybacterium sp. Z12]|uniref:extracellular solute-binding protein n=1 Tax=Brachybacterium sp. Z12 TaxID=2759167 RepID=UPI00223ADA54|nr:extracellular solute-binding protein [Brachybacterium sp. Z12]